MEYNSFYGGRQGAPFILAGSFKLIDKPVFSGTPEEQEAQILAYKQLIQRDLGMAELPTDSEMNAWFEQYCMIPNFQRGDGYKTVNYDEYVIIDSVNKNDFDNGKVFRRGRNYLQENGDAIYIGQIVGPAGVTPHAKMTTIATVQEKAAEAEAATDGRTYRLTSGTYTPTVNLVPGAKGTVNNRTFDTDTDSIQYAMVSVRDVDGHDAEIYVGFKFPYTIIDFYTTSAKPYQDGRYTDVSNIEQVDPKNHPYYEKWHITVPEGVPGDALKNFRVITAANNDGVEAYTGQADDRANSREILVYDYYDYSDYEDGDKKTIYLGSYNMISGITVSNNGTITVSYTHDNDSVFTKKINWITSLSLDANGRFTVNYNNNNISGGTYTTDLKWVKGISISEDGIVTISYTYNNGQPTDVPLDNMKIKYVDHITLNENNNGKLKIYYNTKTNNVQDTDELDLVWVSSVELANNGALTYLDSKGISHSLGSIKWITDSKVLTANDIATDPSSFANNEVGDFVIKFNTDNSYTTLTNIKFISNVQGTSGYLQIDYNNGDPSTYIWQGTTNSTGAIMAAETSEPDPVFAEGSPWFVVEEILPYKRRLNYIQSTGGQYINLNTGIDNSLFEAQIKIQLTATNACNVFGADANGQKEAFYIRNEHISSSNDDRYRLYAGGVISNFSTNSSGMHTLTVGIKPHNTEPNKYTYFYGYIDGSTSGSVEDSLAEIDTLYLLNVKNRSGNYTPAKLYSFKLYKDNILTMDLIPVIDKNDVACLYDNISEEFFYNAGTGHFSYGEVE